MHCKPEYNLKKRTWVFPLFGESQLSWLKIFFSRSKIVTANVWIFYKNKKKRACFFQIISVHLPNRHFGEKL